MRNIFKYRHRCELCGSTGPLAHTRSYCPVAKCINSGERVRSMKDMLCTPTMSSGRRRTSDA